MKLPIHEAALASRVPAGTIRRWLSEGRLIRYGARKPYLVDLGRVEELRDTLRVPTPCGPW